MLDEPAKDLATRAFQKRVLDEFAAMRKDLAEMRSEMAELRTQPTAVMHFAEIDHRLTTLEERVDTRLKEIRPIGEAVQEQVQRLVEKFDVLVQEYYEVRSELNIHGRRIGKLERRS